MRSACEYMFGWDSVLRSLSAKSKVYAVRNSAGWAEQHIKVMQVVDREFFRIGDRVCLSELGEKRLRKPRSKTGKVVGFGFAAARIRVLFDGLREPRTLHHTYLKREQEGDAHQETEQARRRTKS
jgi:hypothetical protein